MKNRNRVIVGLGLGVVLLATTLVSAIAADTAMPKGFSSFGSDQTIADIERWIGNHCNSKAYQPALRSRR
jgi:hypothetical protein